MISRFITGQPFIVQDIRRSRNCIFPIRKVRYSYKLETALPHKPRDLDYNLSLRLFNCELDLTSFYVPFAKMQVEKFCSAVSISRLNKISAQMYSNIHLLLLSRGFSTFSQIICLTYWSMTDYNNHFTA